MAFGVNLTEFDGFRPTLADPARDQAVAPQARTSILCRVPSEGRAKAAHESRVGKAKGFFGGLGLVFFANTQAARSA